MYILNKTKSVKSEVGTPGTPSWCCCRQNWPHPRDSGVNVLPSLKGAGIEPELLAPAWGKLPPYRSIKNIGHQSGAGIEPDPELSYYPLSLVGLEPTDPSPTSMGLEPRTSQRKKRSTFTPGQICRHQGRRKLNPWQYKRLPLEDFSGNQLSILGAAPAQHGAAPESAKSRCVCPSTGAAYLASGSAPGAWAAVHKPLGAAGPQWRGAGGAHAIAKAHAACIHEGGFGPTWAEGGWRSCSHGVVAAAAAADG